MREYEIESLQTDSSQCSLADNSAAKMSREVYENCFRQSTRVLKVPELTSSEAGALETSLPASDPFAELYMEMRKSVAKVETTDDFCGSGFFLDKDGLFVTGFHVVEGSQELFVRTEDGVQHKARLLAADPANDVAMLKVEKCSENELFEPLELAPFDESLKEQELVSYGYGTGQELHFSAGIYDRSLQQKEIKLSSNESYFDENRRLAHIRQRTAHGDSGGPEVLLKDGTVRLMVGMTDGRKNTLAIPAQKIIALRDAYLSTKK